MEHNRLLILFGPPGVGKNYVGELLAEHFGFYFFDLDDEFPPELKTALVTGGVTQGRQVAQDIQVDLRRRVYQRVQDLLVHPRLAVAWVAFRESARADVLQHFPNAEFVLIEAHEEVRKQRIADRRGHWSPAEVAIRSADRFEPVNIPHRVLRNDGIREELLKDLSTFLDT